MIMLGACPLNKTSIPATPPQFIKVNVVANASSAPAKVSGNGPRSKRSNYTRRIARQRRERDDSAVPVNHDVVRWLDVVERLEARMLNPRLTALAQLLRVEYEGAFVGLVGGAPAVAKHPSSRTQDGRDARFVTELVAGVTRMHRLLDTVLRGLVKQDLKSIDAPVLAVLRMGVYELLFMNTPAHAFNDHVELVKKVVRPAAASLVNGVLRNAVRGKVAGTLPLPLAPDADCSNDELVQRLGQMYSHPDWLVKMYLQQFGAVLAVKLLQHNNRRPTYSIRIQRSQGQTATQLRNWLMAELGVECRLSHLLPNDFLCIESRMQAVLQTAWMREGGAAVQDESAGLVVAMLDPQPGQVILDACAAPGGKTLYAAKRMGNQGRIVAADISSVRLTALRRMAARQGCIDIIQLCEADMAALPAPGSSLSSAAKAHVAGASAAAALDTDTDMLSGDLDHGEATDLSLNATRRYLKAEQLVQEQFDSVLLDVPCSGSGVLAKRADLRWRKSEAQLRVLVELQEQLLDSVAPLVKPGGTLVYSTCSVLHCENAGQVTSFLERNADFQLDSAPSGVAEEVLTPEGFMTTFPPEHGTDGAFAARLRRKA